jgi:hypothetical protein
MQLVIETLGGMCPVQGEGTVDGFPFYFRARGASWSFSVADKDGDPVMNGPGEDGFHIAEPYGTWPEAGYMDIGIARAIIERSARKFVESRTATHNDPHGGAALIDFFGAPTNADAKKGALLQSLYVPIMEPSEEDTKLAAVRTKREELQGILDEATMRKVDIDKSPSLVRVREAVAALDAEEERLLSLKHSRNYLASCSILSQLHDEFHLREDDIVLNTGDDNDGEE